MTDHLREVTPGPWEWDRHRVSEGVEKPFWLCRLKSRPEVSSCYDPIVIEVREDHAAWPHILELKNFHAIEKTPDMYFLLKEIVEGGGTEQGSTEARIRTGKRDRRKRQVLQGGLLRMNLAKSSYSLNEIENMYRYGMVTEEEVIEYLKSWNSGPHFTQAVLDGYRIRNFDPEKSGVLYRHLKEKFGLQL